MSVDARSGTVPEVVFVVAMAENGVIGANNAMPWTLKSDLKRFKALTIGKPVVMGRKTFLSIGRPLPGRTNIVVTRDPSFSASRVVVAPSLEAAWEVARGDALRRGSEIAVIGGADVFAQWMPRAGRLEITEVHASPDGDTRMAPIDAAAWREVARLRQAATPSDSADFSYVTYVRRAAAPTPDR